MLRPHSPLRPCLHLLGRTAGLTPSASQEEAQQGNGIGEEERDLARAIARLVAGHASPWPAHLEASLARLAPRLTRPAILRAIDLAQPPAAALRLFRWARFPLDDTPAHYRMLHVLCRSRSSLAPACEFLLSLPSHTLHDRLFNALIRALARAGRLRDAAALFSRMSSAGVQPSVFSYNSLLAAFLRRGRTRSAARLYAHMARAGVAPDVCTLNTLVRGFCLNSMLDEAFRVFKEMAGRGCLPDVVTYNTLLDGLCRTGKVDTARNLLDGMRNKEPDLNPNVVSYTTLIRGYCQKLQAEEAVGVFEDMLACGLTPNKITYNTLIQGLCKAQRMDLVTGLLDASAEGSGGKGFRPDTCTFNTLMAMHCNAGRTEDAVKVLHRMLELHVKPDSATYSTLTWALCWSGKYKEAEELIDELLEKEILRKKGGCVPLMAAYNPISEYLCRNRKAEKAGRLFRQLVEKGATVDIAAFKTLIFGHCKEGDLRKGYELLVLMVRRDLKPDAETFEALINGFLEKGKMGFAWKALEKMLGSGYRPSTNTFHLVLVGLLKKDVYAKQAADLFAVMLERKVRPNIDLSTDVVSSQFRNGLNDRAFKILVLLYENGYCVQMENLVGLLCKSHKFLEAHKLMLFCLDKHQNLSMKLCDMVVSGLCAAGRTSEAFGLFCEMTDKGSGSIFTCLDDLKLALEAKGKLREADFVSKQMSRPHMGHVSNFI